MEPLRRTPAPEGEVTENSTVRRFIDGAFKGAIIGGFLIGALEGADALGLLENDPEAALFAGAVVTAVSGVLEARGRPVLPTVTPGSHE